MIKVCELYKSIQGESSWAGLICSFIRLSGCNLKCSYCDTHYAWSEGHFLEIEQIIEKIDSFSTSLVEITGGEPLLQQETGKLCHVLIKKKYRVLIETNGTFDISILPNETIRIVDIKCPSSGYAGSFLMENLHFLKGSDECKFVISDLNDFNWALSFVRKYQLFDLCQIIFSPNVSLCLPQQLAEWILNTNAEVRLGLQLHKIIWGAEARGV